MLRNKSLIPLSRQHQHALALCVRIERESPIDRLKLGEWQAEIALQFQSEIRVHFAAEEQIVFPPAREFGELTPLVDDLLADHCWLRERFAGAEAGNLSSEQVRTFAQRLSTHIRKEERQLFERLQELMKKEDLEHLGRALDKALESATQACAIPNPKQ